MNSLILLPDARLIPDTASKQDGFFLPKEFTEITRFISKRQGI